MKNLYIFASSLRPDAYINTIAHSIKHHEIGQVCINVIIEEDPLAEPGRQIRALDVLSNINTQLNALRGGRYVEFEHQFDADKVCDLADKQDVDIYSKCLDVISRSGAASRDISYADLESSLVNCTKDRRCLIDASTLKKRYLVDVVSILLSLGFTEVYSFELLKRQSYDQSDLYHSLRHEDFRFRSLLKSDFVNKSLDRMGLWTTRRRRLLGVFILMTIVCLFLSLFFKGSVGLVFFEGAAIAASITSFLSLFVKGGFIDR